MEASDTITAALLSAFLDCPTKARFLSLGERPPDSYFSDVEEAIASIYKSRACRMLHDRGELSELATFAQLTKSGTAAQWFDCETAVCNIESLRRASADTRSRKPVTDQGSKEPGSTYLAVGDFAGDGRRDILVSSPWGIGLFSLAGSTFNVPVMKPNGTRFGGWLLNTADNQLGSVADYDGDGRAEILVTSPGSWASLNAQGPPWPRR